MDLAAIIDLYRRVVGWAMSRHPESMLVINAFDPVLLGGLGFTHNRYLALGLFFYIGCL